MSLKWFFTIYLKVIYQASIWFFQNQFFDIDFNLDILVRSTSFTRNTNFSDWFFRFFLWYLLGVLFYRGFFYILFNWFFNWCWLFYNRFFTIFFTWTLDFFDFSLRFCFFILIIILLISFYWDRCRSFHSPFPLFFLLFWRNVILWGYLFLRFWLWLFFFFIFIFILFFFIIFFNNFFYFYCKRSF